MKRTIYDEDHEAFRASVKEFLDRQVVPHLEEHASREGDPAGLLDRGRQAGLPRARDPGGVRRLGGRGLPVQRGADRGAREGQHGAAVVRRHPRRHRGAVPRAPDHRRAEEAVAAWLLLRRDPDRDRHDRAVGRLRPRGAEDHRGPGRRRLDPERVQDVHHQRLLRRPGDRGGAHVAGEEGQGDHAVRRRHLDATATAAAASWTRSARTSRTPPSCSSKTCGSPTTTSSASSTTASST